MSVANRVLLGGAGILLSQIALAAPVHICVDKTPYPPFVYSEKIKGAGQLRGYSLDLAKQILTALRLPYDVKLMASADIEKRLQSTDVNSGCDIALDRAKTADSERFLLFTPPIYKLNYDLAYSWERYMTGLGVKTVADLNKFQLCGINSYDYGSLEKQLKIRRVASIKDAVFDLKNKSCDGFIAEAVTMKYGQRMNSYQVPPVGCVRLEDTSKNYYMGIAKHTEGASQLVVKFQQQLAVLSAKDGVVSKLTEDYDVTPMTCQETIKVTP